MGAVTPGRGAFTLIEVLVVVSLLGMVVGLACHGLQAVHRPDPLAATRDRLAHQFTMVVTRALARGGGAIRLTADGIDPAGAETRATLPARVAFRTTDGAIAAAWTYDTHGRGRDLFIDISTDGERQRWLRSGISGTWMRWGDDR